MPDSVFSPARKGESVDCVRKVWMQARSLSGVTDERQGAELQAQAKTARAHPE